MASDPEQKSVLRVEIVIAAAALLVSIVAYVRPPDPAHPMRFDFLSKTFSLPLWMAGVAVVGIAAITATVIRLRERKHDPISPDGISAPMAKAITTQPATPATPRMAVTTSVPSSGAVAAELEITSTEDLVVSIGPYEYEGVKCLGLKVMNNRLTAVHQVTIRLPLAASFDSRLSDFRQGDIYRNAQILQQEVIQPSCSGSRSLIIRKRKEDAHLMIGDTVGNLMVWPQNDKSVIQKWRVPVGVTAQVWPQNYPSGAKWLTPIEFVLIVFWNMETNEFSIDKA